MVNFWNIPTIFPITEEEAREKIIMIKEILDTIGLPVIDDEFLGNLEKFEIKR